MDFFVIGKILMLKTNSVPSEILFIEDNPGDVAQ
jgi:hypothetical protein